MRQRDRRRPAQIRQGEPASRVGVLIAWTACGLAWLLGLATIGLAVAGRVPPYWFVAEFMALGPLFGMPAALLGARMIERRRANRLGWILLAMGLAQTIAQASNAYAALSVDHHGGSLPGTGWPPGCTASRGCRSWRSARSCCCCFPMGGCPDDAGAWSPGPEPRSWRPSSWPPRSWPGRSAGRPCTAAWWPALQGRRPWMRSSPPRCSWSATRSWWSAPSPCSCACAACGAPHGSRPSGSPSVPSRGWRST